MKTLPLTEGDLRRVAQVLDTYGPNEWFRRGPDGDLWVVRDHVRPTDLALSDVLRACAASWRRR